MKKIIFLFSLIVISSHLFSQERQKPLQIKRNKFSLYIYTPSKLFFDLKSYKLNESNKYELGVIAYGLIDNKNVKVEIAVYNDSRLDPEVSMKITQKRADAIKNYLIICGVNPDNLIAKGYGDTVIINKCKPFVKCTDAEHAKNRRVEFKILNPEKLTNFKMVKK